MKLAKLIIATFLFLGCQLSFAQEADSLLAELSVETEQTKLLPEKMLLTQRLFWGEKGLYRKMGIVPELTPENRQRELRIRRNMFKIHQAFGWATAAGMLAQGILGARLYKGNAENFDKIKKAHEATALGINIAYTTTALMAFTSPPAQVRRKGTSTASVHRALSYVHISGMIATNVLSRQIEKSRENQNFERLADMKGYHRAAAFTTFATFATAIAILKFEF
ncbi:MAG: hypothetical protein ACK4NY_18215 [Spirosomataceae bacterium]